MVVDVDVASAVDDVDDLLAPHVAAVAADAGGERATAEVDCILDCCCDDDLAGRCVG